MRRLIALFAAFSMLGGCGSDEGDPEAHAGASGSGAAAGADAAAGGGASGASGASGAGTSGGESGGSGGTSGVAGASGTAGTASVDADGDGLDDALELSLAADHYPYHSIHPDDKCPRHGVLFRATPHPDDATRVMIWYVVLLENDCGANGHVGDDEVFGAVLDPALPPGQSVLALRAISHQGTICEKITTCGKLPGCQACALAKKGSVDFPVVFASVNKHGQYVEESTCDLNVICDFGGCTLNPTPSNPPFVNAGEPDKPLVNDLTADGFIAPTYGWTESSLMGFDPWANQDFGSAGNVTDDLTDASFVVPITGCN